MEVIMENFKYSEKQCDDFYKKFRKKFKRPTNEEEKDRIKKHIPDFAYGVIDYYCFTPDLLYLTIRLIFDETIPVEKKTGLISAIIYFISPYDIIPDYIPYAGYVDDFIVLTYFLNKFFDSENEFVVKAIDEYWLGDKDLMELLQEIGKVLNKIYVTLGIDKIIDKPNQIFIKVIKKGWEKYMKKKNELI